MAAETIHKAIEKIDFKMIGTCRWQIDEARDETGKEVLNTPPDGRPYELLFFLACRPDMQATRREINDYFWQDEEGRSDRAAILKTWIMKLTKGYKLPAGDEWQRAFPIETKGDFVRLKDGCTSDMQEFWKLRDEARHEENAHSRRAKLERMKAIDRQQLIPRAVWHWVERLREAMRAEIKSVEDTIPKVLSEEDLPSPGELPGNLTYPRNPYFQGREEIFHRLCAQLTGSNISAWIQALPGLGGMGKTETAVEFAYRCFDKKRYPGYPSYNRILWTRADDPNALRNGYAAIAKLLPDFPYRDEKDINLMVPEVIRWLSNPKHRGWLLIMDNADHPDIVWDFLPRHPDQRQGHVLLTSRSQTFMGDIKPIPLEPMQTEEALAFLYGRTGRNRAGSADEKQKASEIVEELGGLPLALEQAAVFLQKYPALRFTDYLVAHRKRRKELLEFHAQSRPYQAYNTTTDTYEHYLTVWTTWDMTFQEIVKHFPRSADLLTLTTWLAPTPIPCEIIYAAYPDDFANAESEEERAEIYARLLAPLQASSLVKIMGEERAFSVHILVQTVLRDGQLPEEQQRVCERVIRATADSFPSDDWVLGGRCELYYIHAERLCDYVLQTGMEGEAVVRLLNQTGTFLFERGRFAEATPLFQQALDRRKKALPDGHLDIAVNLNDLALLYHIQKRFDEAEPLYRQALAMKREAFPEGHAETAISLNCLAQCLEVQRRFTEAEPLYWEALTMRRQIFPEGHHTIGNILGNLGGFYRATGRFAEAEPLFEQALQIVQKALPEGHPYIATFLNNLARVYQDQGRFAEAESLFNQALAIRRKALPEGHPHLIIVVKNLAKLYQDQGRFAEAVPLYREVLAMMLPTLGMEHPDYQEANRNHLSCLVQMGKEEEAEQIFPGFLVWYRVNMKKDEYAKDSPW